jgi:hypothetical protein
LTQRVLALLFKRSHMNLVQNALHPGDATGHGLCNLFEVKRADRTVQYRHAAENSAVDRRELAIRACTQLL